MPIEIERKFLVCSDEWRAAPATSSRYRQAYLSKSAEGSVRVRRREGYATITVKGPRVGLVRDEFEYRIPVLHADHMLRHLCVTPVIEKVRHRVDYAGMTWEVDVYGGEAAGLVLAEVELERIDQPFVVPSWVGPDVTHDPNYCSSGIVQGLWRHRDISPRKSAKPGRAGVRSKAARPGDWAHELL